jgi:hypothetical protein
MGVLFINPFALLPNNGGFARGGLPVDLSAVAQGAFEGTAATETITSAPLGAADAARVIILAINWRHSAVTDRAISGVTIGGVTATQRINAPTSGTKDWGAEIWTATVPTGTTGDIVITVSGAVIISSYTYQVFRAVGLLSETPAATNSASGGAGALSNSLSLSGAGFCISAFAERGTTAPPTFAAGTTLINAQTSLGAGQGEVGVTTGSGTFTPTMSGAGATTEQSLVSAGWLASTVTLPYPQQNGGSATVAHRATYTSTATVGASPVTVVTGADLGTAAADRVIILTYAHTSSGGARLPTAVTIGGVSATLVGFNRDAATNPNASIWYAAVPTGTTGNIVVTASSANLNDHVIGVYRATGLYSAVPMYVRRSQITDGSFRLPVGVGFAIGVSCIDSNLNVTVDNLPLDATNQTPASILYASNGHDSYGAIGSVAVGSTRAFLIAAAWV